MRAEREHGVATGPGDAEGVDGDVGAAVGHRLHGLGGIGGFGVDRLDGAELLGSVELVVDQVDDDVRIEDVGDVGRRQLDAAAAVGGDPVAGLDVGDVRRFAVCL